MIYDILTDEQIQRFESNLELDFSYSAGARSPASASTSSETRATSAVAFRVIPQRIPTLEELELPAGAGGATRKPRGLVLVTGPTGSGKSTTLAAMINQINTERSEHILTIEDPIEYLHHAQVQHHQPARAGQDTKSFANALRAALREDPDVILVGEMRDLETMQLAVTAAETGHLVFATLHTNSAAHPVDRIVDVVPARPAGADPHPALQQPGGDPLPAADAARQPAGPRLRHGDHDRPRPAIRNLIREAKAHQITSMIQTSANVGMQTMDQCLRDLYATRHDHVRGGDRPAPCSPTS